MSQKNNKAGFFLLSLNAFSLVIQSHYLIFFPRLPMIQTGVNLSHHPLLQIIHCPKVSKQVRVYRQHCLIYIFLNNSFTYKHPVDSTKCISTFQRIHLHISILSIAQNLFLQFQHK